MSTEKLELERANAIARHLKRVAAQHQSVKVARAHLFGSAAESVSPERMFGLLASPATHVLGERHFEEHGIPWGEHRASVVRASRRDDPDGGWREYDVRVRWPRREQVIRARVTVWDVLGHAPAGAMLPGPGGPEGYAVYPGTWLWRIVESAKDVARAFGWGTAEAARFIMTGEAPAFVPLRAAISRSPSGAPLIVLHAAPFVDRGAVLDALLAQQRKLDGVRVFRQRRRPLQLRALYLFDFADEHRPRKTWGQVLAAWNRRYPAWSYAAPRPLRRDFLLARKRILHGFASTAPARSPGRWVAPKARGRER